MSPSTTHPPLAPPRASEPPAELSRLERVRLRLAARLTRWARWEFWPWWAVYAPAVPMIVLDALRHRPLLACTAVNPAMPDGGIIGESKSAILALLPEAWVAPTCPLPPAPIADRLAALDRFMRDRGIDFPIILKPDVGERGTGVRLIPSPERARDYLLRDHRTVIAQRYHPGPHEAGVFYVRHPGQPAGHILSLTTKSFPTIRGDARSSIRTLIWRDPRLRAQAHAFLDRLGPRADTVPARDETVHLAVAGNHCRGTLFLDGAALITPAVTRAFDAITAQAPGIFFGRFDVRYHDPAGFAAGAGFEIIELNGLLSEPTNIYQPGFGYWRAQHVLREHWRWANRIGLENHRRGAPLPSPRELLVRIRSHTRRTIPDPGSD